MASGKSPISILQEMAQSNSIGLPVYDVQPIGSNFRARLKLGNSGKIFSEATGTSKQSAKKMCAENALKLLNGQNVNFAKQENLTTKSYGSLWSPSGLSVNYVGKLNEICAKRYELNPIYTECGVKNGKFIIECRMFDNTVTLGQSSTKKDAKQKAAEAMLEIFSERQEPVSQTFIEIHNKTNISSNSSSLYEPFANYVGKLNEICAKRRKQEPSYAECGMENGKYVIECRIFNNTIARGQATTKKDAKQKAAEVMLRSIGELTCEKDAQQKDDEEIIKIFTNSLKLESQDLMKSVTIINSINNRRQKPMEELIKQTAFKQSDLTSVENMSEKELKMELKHLNVIYEISRVSGIKNLLRFKTIPTRNCKSFTFISTGEDNDEVYLELLRKAVYGMRILKS